MFIFGLSIEKQCLTLHVLLKKDIDELNAWKIIIGLKKEIQLNKFFKQERKQDKHLTIPFKTCIMR